MKKKLPLYGAASSKKIKPNIIFLPISLFELDLIIVCFYNIHSTAQITNIKARECN
jgi:hypothetical protein